MKSFLILLACLFSVGMLTATAYVSEHFSSFPPTGWTFEQEDNWLPTSTNVAGGTAPEAMLSWTPQFTTPARMISPTFDLTGATTAYVSFRHAVDWYSNSFVVGLATRHAGGAWTTVWSQSCAANVNPEQRNVTITNADVTAGFQFCLFFTGDSMDIDYWYLDDVYMYTLSGTDVTVDSIVLDPQYTANTAMTPHANIMNYGSAAATFDVTCAINQYSTPVYTQTQQVTLAAGGQQNVAFPAFTPAVANEIYYLTVTTALAGDENTANDVASGTFNTWDGERQDVVVEIGTGTWCQYCPGAAMGADDLVEEGYPVAVVEYHADDDYETEESLNRCVYYGISGFPTAVFDGLEQFIGGSHTASMLDNYIPYVEDRQGVKCPFSLEMQGGHSGNNYQIEVAVTKLGRLPANTEFVLHFAVTESGIQEAWQGQTQLDFVERTMCPGDEGTPLNFTDDVQLITLDFVRNSAWVADNLELVAFVQNPITKEIFQGLVVALPDLSSPYIAPSDLTCDVQGTDVVLNWTAPTGATGLTGYKIYRDNTMVHAVTDPGITTWTDHLTITGDFFYHVTAVYGTMESAPTEDVLASVVANGPGTVVPAVTSLNGNYPNPFNPTTKIDYSLKTAGLVNISVYDVRGQLVKTLVNDTQTAGNYKVTWNGDDNNGSHVASGVYFSKMQAGDYTSMKKMIMLK
jgi:hypothetical protein